VSRQAYYNNKNRIEKSYVEEQIIVQEVKEIRKDHKMMGTRKLLTKLSPKLRDHNINIGRDTLFDILRDNDLLVKKRKRKVITTNSRHWMKKYPNLIKDIIPLAPNQIWVSDITYWKCNDKHLYISFITDAYSHKIVGHHIADNLETVESINALQLALKDIDVDHYINRRLIHHSDRGSQYCSKNYVNILRAYNIEISMTQSGDPLDNAIAERVNGILKEEYLHHYNPENLEQAREALDRSVELYNSDRPHNSIGNLTPDQVHNKTGLVTKRLWKNYYKPEINKNADILKNVYQELE